MKRELIYIDNSKFRIQKEKKVLCVAKGQFCSQETITVLLEAWVRGSQGNELFLATCPCSIPGPHTASLSGSVRRDLTPSLHTLPIHPLSCYSIWIHTSLCATGKRYEQLRGSNSHLQLAAPGRRKVPWRVASPPELWVSDRDHCFQEQTK